MKNKPKIEQIKTSALIPYARNSRTHSEAQVAQIAGSIREFGFTNPVLIDADNGIIAGHGRIMAAQKLGLAEVPCIRLDHLTETQRKAYIIADNKLALNAGWDEEMLGLELADLRELDFDLGLLGFDEEELGVLFAEPAPEAEGGSEGGAGSLSAKFGIPPFSVLNAREGWWQDRKRAWLATGIKSELGRGEELIGKAAPNSAYGKQSTGIDREGKLTYKESVGNTSTFDPVLCELAYRWFSPAGGTVLDPFAGGSVRGIVASHCGRQYVGMDLRAEQIEANRAQADVARDPQPVWHCGDSLTIDKVCADVDADFVFSCPPYADLEVYSDDPADLSTMEYEDFRAVYFEIIAKACSRLKEDRFACFVVGDVRDKKGNYYNFVGDTVEAILVTCVGSLPIRAGKQFSSGRKLGKTHQNVLVFVKGDGKKAAEACGECDFGDAAEIGSDSDLGEQL